MLYGEGCHPTPPGRRSTALTHPAAKRESCGVPPTHPQGAATSHPTAPDGPFLRRVGLRTFTHTPGPFKHPQHRPRDTALPVPGGQGLHAQGPSHRRLRDRPRASGHRGRRRTWDRGRARRAGTAPAGSRGSTRDSARPSPGRAAPAGLTWFPRTPLVGADAVWSRRAIPRGGSRSGRPAARTSGGADSRGRLRTHCSCRRLRRAPRHRGCCRALALPCRPRALPHSRGPRLTFRRCHLPRQPRAELTRAPPRPHAEHPGPPPSS